MEWSRENLLWFDICAGRRSSVCEALLPAADDVLRHGFHYCRVCALASRPLHCVHVSFDHHNEGMSVTYSSIEDSGVVLWLVGVSKHRVIEMVTRGRVARCQLHEVERSVTQWGRGSLYTHLDHVQYANLVRAWRYDPRNGQEKAKDLPPGRRAATPS